jgi:isopentenyl-diphosphate Delta-isomerase
MTAPAARTTPAEELVVLLDEAGNAVGTEPKRTVHHASTPLHLAFSCYVFDGAGSLLLTQRALHKPTWPGVWTNSVCGHPLPGEDLADAVARRVLDEIGVRLQEVRLALPGFRYQAVMDNGVRENEMCPVFTAVTTEQVQPCAEEVADTAWVPWAEFRDEVLDGRRDVSPWCREQVTLLDAQERALGHLGGGDWAELPSAARRR